MFLIPKQEVTVGRVVRLERFSKALGACEGKLIVDRNHYDLLVQMIDEVI